MIAEANLSGLDTLFNRLVDEDKDLKKVEALDTHNNMLEETIDEYRRDFEHAVEEFMETVTERRKIKVTETKGDCFSFTTAVATEPKPSQTSKSTHHPARPFPSCRR